MMALHFTVVRWDTFYNAFEKLAGLDLEAAGDQSITSITEQGVILLPFCASAGPSARGWNGTRPKANFSSIETRMKRGGTEISIADV